MNVTTLPSGLLLAETPARDFDARHDTPIRVTILDTVTGETADGLPGYGTYWWTEGNGSCDCNREVSFDSDALDRDEAGGGTCLGCVRYRIVAVEPLLPGYTLADFNDGYPEAVCCQTCARPAPFPHHVILGYSLDTPGGRWHHHVWSCRHASTWECPTCYNVPRDDPAKAWQSCPVCGQSCELT